MILDKKKREGEIYEIRQKVYSKLNQGRNVYSLMRMFKWKVERYSRTFGVKLSYDEEKKWRDKVVITEKAVVRIRNERKATMNAVIAQELITTVKHQLTLYLANISNYRLAYIQCWGWN